MARVDLYYVFGIYMVLTFGIAIHIFLEKRKKSQHQDDNIGDHFLAGKSTNLVILCATTFSTIFSGYTMIGVPSEAYEDGAYACECVCHDCAVLCCGSTDVCVVM
jgi:Na+/proline symporter